MNYLKIFGVFLLLAFNQFTFADSSGDHLQKKLKALKSMSASFTQTVKANHRTISRSSGTMALMRPGRFRWQTTSPTSQLVIASGVKIWVYDADLEQVSVKKQSKEINGTTGVFLSGDNDNINRDFKVTELMHGQQVLFDLQAKSNKESIHHLKLLFEGDVLSGIELFDQLGQHTNIHLSHIKTNVTLSPKLFQFNIPKGVDVVQQ